MTDTHTLEGYFQEYRNKLNLLNEARAEHKNAHVEMLKTMSKVEKINNEINDMRRVITLIVEKGLDPVEARLSINDADENSIWDRDQYEVSVSSSIYDTAADTTSSVFCDIADIIKEHGN